MDLDVCIERNVHLDRDYGFILGLLNLKYESGLDLNVDLGLASLGPDLDHDFQFRSGRGRKVQGKKDKNNRGCAFSQSCQFQKKEKEGFR